MGLHLRVEAPLLGHVAESEPVVWPYRALLPTNRAGVESDEPKDGPHRRRFACAIGSEKSEHSTSGDIESAVIGCDDVAEALVKVLD